MYILLEYTMICSLWDFWENTSQLSALLWGTQAVVSWIWREPGSCHLSSLVWKKERKLQCQLFRSLVQNCLKKLSVRYYTEKKKKLQVIVTCDMWHVTHRRLGEVNLLSRFQLPSSSGLGGVLKICSQRINPLISWLITKVLVENPGFTVSLINI